MTLLTALLFVVLLCGPSNAQAMDQAVPASEEGIAARTEEDNQAAARQVVEGLHAELLSCMKQGEKLGFQGRYDRIVANLEHSFDLPLMARAAVSSAWKQLDPKQRADFIDLTRRLSASRYADNFSSYGGQSFETLTTEPAARDTIVVKTLFVQPDDRDVRFDYRLRHVPAGWRVIDVQLEGMISELAIRRGQYRSVIEREGFPQLVETLEERIDELSQQ
jgi:phospholipid transport system substrate-binding protein